MVSGGAPLSEVTHDLIRSCIGCSVMQGYGLTETTSCAALMDGERGGGGMEHTGTGASWIVGKTIIGQ